jgi:DNA mismatch repair ATPase MutS
VYQQRGGERYLSLKHFLSYVKKFESMGYDVVIMDQTNHINPKSKGEVRRVVTRVYTPGTLGDLWVKDEANYLLAVKEYRANSCIF